MVYFGTVRNGKVELGPEAKLPEGVTVRVEPVAPAASPTTPESDDPLYRLADLAVDGGPPDVASEHDHYAYGTPKQGPRR